MLVAFGFMEYELLHGVTSDLSGHAAFFFYVAYCNFFSIAEFPHACKTEYA